MSKCTARGRTMGRTPPTVRSPRLVQGVEFAVLRHRAMHTWTKRHGRVFAIDIPFFGRSVVVSDPAVVRSICAADPQRLVNVQPNMSNLFGSGSIFALDGAAHHERRRVLAPALRGHRLAACEQIIERETFRECATWPDGVEFATLRPMSRITLNVILRIVFGDAPDEIAALRRLVPPFMRLGQLLAFAPAPPPWIRGCTPWRRLDAFRADFDRIVTTLVDKARADPRCAERTDILSLLLRCGRCEGSAALSDELLTLIGAGYETTAAALAWTFERLRRHPDVLADLVREVDDGGAALRRATVFEVLRSRTVLDVAGRRVEGPTIDLGGWQVSRHRTVLIRIADLHEDPENFTDPGTFDPHRFLGVKPAAPTWLAFGGGTRRCLGADFAITEMDVVLRTVLRHVRIHTDDAADEKSRFHGVAHAPKRGGRIVVDHRTELSWQPT
ncbi:MAG: cytochrome P450 [Mycolicibacterium rufum]|nr:cytochrome P450 [Mycolicibacterium rufum]